MPLNTIEGLAPCIPLQEGMIFNSVESKRSAYFTNFSFSLTPAVDLERLKFSWQRTQETFQILRTKFPLTAGGYSQTVLREDRLPWFEMSVSDDTKLRQTVMSRYKRWCSSSKILTGTVWEVGVVIGPSRKYMCLNMFHGLYDETSLDLILQGVARSYIGQPTIKTTTLSFLEALPIGPLLKAPGAKDFWLEHLKDYQPQRFQLDPNLDEDLRTIACIEALPINCLNTLRRRVNVTDQAILLACWLLLQQSIFKFMPTIGVVVSGRLLEDENVDNVVGPMFNTLPCNMRFSSDSNLPDFIHECHSYLASVLQFQHTALRDIMKWIRKSPDMPLFESLFVYRKDGAGETDIGGQLWSPTVSHAQSDYPLAFEAQQRLDGSMKITIIAQNRILDSDRVRQLGDQYAEMLTMMSKDEQFLQNLGLSPSHEQKMADHSQTVNCATAKVNSNFHWDNTALRIKQEIAIISNLEPNAIGPETSILELGLDSIDAIKLSSRLKKIGVKITVSSIMRTRSIKNMVREASTSNDSAELNGMEYIQRMKTDLRIAFENEGRNLSTVECILPATPLQEAMIADMFSSKYNRYFNQDVFLIENGVEIERLKAAWNAVIEKNAILRTGFVEVVDPKFPFTYAQIVWTPGELNWTIENNKNLTIEDAMINARNQAKGTAWGKPLLRFQLLKLNSQILLIMSIPHAMYDGWSLELLHSEVAKQYSGQGGKSSSYYEMLGQTLSTSRHRGRLFWKSLFNGYHFASFPKLANSGQNYTQVHRKEIILAQSYSDVSSLCRANGLSVQTLGFLTWALVLASFQEKLDIAFGTILAGRDTPEAEGIMFPLMNSVPLRIILHGSQLEMLKYIQETLGTVRQYQNFPLRETKALSGIGNHDLFDTLFIYQRKPPMADVSQETLYKSITSYSEVEYPVCAEMECVDRMIVWRVACRDTVLGQPDTLNLLGRIREVFGNIVANINDPVINFTKEGISICRFPPFQECETNGVVEQTHTTAENQDQWSPMEQTIRSVVAYVAHVSAEEVSRSTTLFELGLDSISAIKLSSLLKRKSITLTVSGMLREATVPKIARLAKSNRGIFQVYDTQTLDRYLGNILEYVDVDEVLKANSICRNNVERVIPATAGQLYMLGMENGSRGLLYFPTFCYTVKGKLQSKRLEESWKHLVDDVSILRTQLLPTGNCKKTFIQVVQKNLEIPVRWLNTSNGSKVNNSRKSHTKELVQLYASETLDNATAIALRIHHALYDAVSIPKIIGRLMEYCIDEDAQIVNKPEMADFAVYSVLHSAADDREKFWKEYLAGANHANESNRSMHLSETIKCYRPSLIEDISYFEGFSRSQGITVQALFLAVFAVIQGETSGQAARDVVIGIYLANRSHPLEGLPDMLAPTVNIVPLRIRFKKEQPVISLARDIQKDLLEISRIENSCVSLIEIADWTGVKLDTFVNFLKLPEYGNERDSKSTSYPVEFVPTDDDDQTGGFKSKISKIAKEERQSSGDDGSNGNKDIYVVCRIR